MAQGITCLKQVVKTGGRSFPLFVGFLSAEQIARIAEAPSFARTQSHEDLASNVLRPPVKDWQRPLAPDRVDTIKEVFKVPGALMPNPVLLSANGNTADQPKIKPQTVNGSTPTGAYVVTVPDDRPVGSKPLWVLDGQHRIAGLSVSPQKDSPVPVVLLLNDDMGTSYAGSDFAKLFAQVTTSAEKLQDLHNSWLTYAYELDEYSEANPTYQDHRRAMETVCRMCDNAVLSDGTPNPFHNRVRFNPYVPVPRDSPFVKGCGELKEIVRRHYFAEAGSSPLSPQDLANELGLALRALEASVKAPRDESVYFGTDEYAQVAMQDAFLVASLSYLRETHRKPWAELLSDLQFDQTDWNFRAWVKTLSGKAGSDSRAVAERVLVNAFISGSLPGGTRLDDYLSGSGASVDVYLSRLNSNDRPVKHGRIDLKLGKSETKSRTLDAERHVRIDPAYKRSNIARLEVVDAKSSPSSPRKIPGLPGKGHVLEPASGGDLALELHMVFYGGLGSGASLTLKW